MMKLEPGTLVRLTEEAAINLPNLVTNYGRLWVASALTDSKGYQLYKSVATGILLWFEHAVLEEVDD